MRDEIQNPSDWPDVRGKLKEYQITNRATWAHIPDANVVSAAMHSVTIVPAFSTTITTVNPLDPGTVGGRALDGVEAEVGWLDRPAGYGHVSRPGAV